MAIITNSSNDLRDTIIEALLEINAACWYVRRDQNTRDGSAGGLQVMLPKEVQFQVVFGQDGAINAVTRTQTSSPGDVTEESTQTTPQTTSNSTSNSTRTETESLQERAEIIGQTISDVTAIETGGDETVVVRDYEEVG